MELCMLSARHLDPGRLLRITLNWFPRRVGDFRLRVLQVCLSAVCLSLLSSAGNSPIYPDTRYTVPDARPVHELTD